MIRSIDAIVATGGTTIGDATGAGNSAPATSGRTILSFQAGVRKDDRWFAFNPCRRATSFTVTPGTSVSATIRPFASSDHRRLAAGAASSSINLTASILRSQWTPTDASRANLHTRAHRSLRIQQEGGGKTALTHLPKARGRWLRAFFLTGTRPDCSGSHPAQQSDPAHRKAGSRRTAGLRYLSHE